MLFSMVYLSPQPNNILSTATTHTLTLYEVLSIHSLCGGSVGSGLDHQGAVVAGVLARGQAHQQAEGHQQERHGRPATFILRIFAKF